MRVWGWLGFGALGMRLVSQHSAQKFVHQVDCAVEGVHIGGGQHIGVSADCLKLAAEVRHKPFARGLGFGLVGCN